MEDSGALGSLIRRSRLDKGLSIGQLASAINRSASSVRRWERGDVAPAVAVLPDLAEILELDEEELQRMIESVHPPLPSAPYAESSEVAIPKTETTIEDEVSIVDAVPYFETPSPRSAQPRQIEPGRFGRFSSAIFGRRDSWIGWVRGILTALALLFLFFGLVWAIGELMTALGEVLDTFSAGTSDG